MLKGNEALARQVQAGLPAVPGILHVEANALTGSLLVIYDPIRYPSTADLIRLGEQLPGFDGTLAIADPAAGPAADAAPSERLAADFAALNARVRGLTGGPDLKLLVPLALFGLGIRGLLAFEGSLPAWYDFLWFSFGTYMMLNRPAASPR